MIKMWLIYTILFTICISLIIYFCWRKRREITLMSRLPGPSLFAYLKLAFVIGFSDYSKLFKTFEDLYATYGSIVSLWFGTIPVVFLKDPKHIDKYYKQDQTHRKLPDIVNEKVMGPIFKGGVIALQEGEWRKRRKIINIVFHNNIVDNFVDNFNKNSNILVNRMEKRANGFFEALQTLFAQCTIDIVCENVFCYNMDVQKRNDTAIVENLEASVKVIASVIFNPFLFNNFIYRLSKAGRTQESIASFLHHEINRGINNRITEAMRNIGDPVDFVKQKGDLIGVLLNNSKLNRGDIVGDVASIAGGGAETAAITSCFALALLCENQDIQERVVEEQRRIFNDDMLGPVTNDNINHMTYLEQVIKETLRLYPAIPQIYRNNVEEIEIDDGKIVPKGSIVVINTYSIQRDGNNYSNPQQFDPDRFAPENSISRPQYTYFPFGHGRRMCIGHRFALLELKTVLSTVLRRYHFLEVEGGLRSIDESLQAGLVLKPIQEFKFRFLPRKF